MCPLTLMKHTVLLFHVWVVIIQSHGSIILVTSKITLPMSEHERPIATAKMVQLFLKILVDNGQHTSEA